MQVDTYIRTLRSDAIEFRRLLNDTEVSCKLIQLGVSESSQTQSDFWTRFNFLKQKFGRCIASQWDNLRLNDRLGVSLGSSTAIDWHKSPDQDDYRGLFGSNPLFPFHFLTWLVGYDCVTIELLTPNEREIPQTTSPAAKRIAFHPGVLGKLASELFPPIRSTYFVDESVWNREYYCVLHDSLRQSCSMWANACDLFADFLDKPSSPKEPITRNPDCTFVEWGAVRASLNDSQAACFMVLWSGWKAGSQPLSSRHIWNEAPKLFLAETGRHVKFSYTPSLSAVFRSNNISHSFWKTLITSPKTGFYELSLSRPDSSNV